MTFIKIFALFYFEILYLIIKIVFLGMFASLMWGRNDCLYILHKKSSSESEKYFKECFCYVRSIHECQAFIFAMNYKYTKILE